MGNSSQKPPSGDSERAGEGLLLPRIFTPAALLLVAPPSPRPPFGRRPLPRFAPAVDDSATAFHGRPRPCFIVGPEGSATAFFGRRPRPRAATTGSSSSISFFGAMVG